MSKLFYFSPADENFPHTIQEIGRESLSVVREKTDEELYSQDAAPLPDPIPVTFFYITHDDNNVIDPSYDGDIDVRGFYQIYRTDTNEEVSGDLISWSVENNNSNGLTPTPTPGVFKVTGEGFGNFVFTFTGDESEYSIDEKSIKEPFIVGEPQTEINTTTTIPGHMEIGATHTIELKTTPSDLDLSYVKVTTDDPEVIKASGLTLTAVGEGGCNVSIRFLGDGVHGPSRITDKYIDVY